MNLPFCCRERRLGAALALVAIGWMPYVSAAGQTGDAAGKVSALLDGLAQMRAPVTAAISPDGRRVAWAFGSGAMAELHLTELGSAAKGAAGDRVIAPELPGSAGTHCSAGHPAWSPEGGRLAFLSNCSAEGGTLTAGKQENVWVWTQATGALRQVSRLHGAIRSLEWSPDGRSIGFLFVENATRQAGALDAMKPWAGVIGEDGVEVQRIYAVDVATGRGNFLSANAVSHGPNLHVYEFVWAPDSQQVAYVAAAPPGENNWWTAKLYVQSVGYIAVCEEIKGSELCKHSGAPNGVPQAVLDPQTNPGQLHGLQIAVPRFSPDGKQIAFIGGLMSDQGSTGGDIYMIPATGSAAGAQPRDVTPGRPATPAWIEWRNSNQLLVAEHVGGSSRITAIDVTTGKDDPAVNLTLAETFIAGTDVMSVSTSDALRQDSAGNVAVIRQSFARAPEVWAGPLTAMQQISHLNDALMPRWGKAESIDWTNDGFRIQGWLLYPAGYDPATRYPLIVSVHGGPSSAVSPRWPEAAYGAVPFSALGYFVFMPNPRGSYGQGERFTQANRKDFGYGDLRDVLAGLDTLEKRLPIDPAREGITGWSYGGFMTMFAVTQTTRFHAAVAGAGISDWLSYYGENSIDQWMVPFFGATVYDDPAVYAKSSPIDFIKNVKTPTLVVVGDRDGECPAPQSFEFWHALRAEDVKTQLVVYSNEGHHFADPSHRKDVLRRALEWFETQMPKGRE